MLYFTWITRVCSIRRIILSAITILIIFYMITCPKLSGQKKSSDLAKDIPAHFWSCRKALVSVRSTALSWNGRWKLDEFQVISSGGMIQSSAETLHVLITVNGSNMVTRFSTMLKSLFYYRGYFDEGIKNCSKFVVERPRCPIEETRGFIETTLHIFVEQNTRKVLLSEIHNWHLPRVNWYLYELDMMSPCVKWIPNKHFAGLPGLIKLFLPYILPTEVEKILLLDVDVLLNCDIYEMWLLFNDFKPEQSIGFAVEQIDQDRKCKRDKRSLLPKMGINGGVGMLHLSRMRELDWYSILAHSIRRALRRYVVLITADQDVWNSLIPYYPKMFYQIPCSWNVQMNVPAVVACCPSFWLVKHPKESDCFSNMTRQTGGLRPKMAKLIHFNGPGKVNANTPWDPKIKLENSQTATMTLDQLRARYRIIYSYFRHLPHTCFH